jgi:hypothetical protein
VRDIAVPIADEVDEALLIAEAERGDARRAADERRGRDLVVQLRVADGVGRVEAHVQRAVLFGCRGARARRGRGELALQLRDPIHVIVQALAIGAR